MHLASIFTTGLEAGTETIRKRSPRLPALQAAALQPPAALIDSHARILLPVATGPMDYILRDSEIRAFTQATRRGPSLTGAGNLFAVIQL